MKTYSLLILFLVMTSFASGQNKDTSSVRITNYSVVPGTYSWRNTNTYFDRTPTWESGAYTEGHLRHSASGYRQNFRLLYPGGYDANYDPGYPLMVVLHGGGERANCWQNGSNYECYYGTTSYNPNTAPLDGTIDQINNLLNNDHNLLHGGQQYLNARNRAGTMTPNDPNVPPNAFPGFVFFPQMLNNWGPAEVRDAIRTVRLLCKQLNIDEDRVYLNGISMGGRGALYALNEADWIFAAVATMSAIPSHTTFRAEADSAVTIPLWMFQGGQDTNPNPGATRETIRVFQAAGGLARYTLYPNLGHGTWNAAYKEPDYFTWFLTKDKTDIHAYFGTSTICATNGVGAKLSLPQGFLAYQWEKDGVIIPGATSYIYVATQPGVYRARYSRLSATPTAAQWNKWSKPLTVGEQAPAAPVVTQNGSIVLKDLNGSNTARLVGPPGFTNYYWYKNGVLAGLPNAPNVTITAGTCNGPCTNAGTYTLVTTTVDQCPSQPSEGKTIFFDNQAPINIPVPTNFTASLSTSATEVVLRWNDVSTSERNYEIWRRKDTDAANNGWRLVTITPEDAIVYGDKGLEPNTTYWYKIRAISNTGRSDYAPGNSKTEPSQNVIITTGSDTTPPTPPQNLTAVLKNTDIATRLNSIQITWEAATDETGLKEYQIKYGSNVITVPPTQTTYLLQGLPLNSEFNFTVLAIDLSGNISPPSNLANAKTYIDGLFWEHSTGAYTDIRNVPPSMWERPEYTGRVSNLNLSPATQEEFIIFRYYGYINITTAGDYSFRLRSNDGVQMWIDGTQVIRRTGTVTDGSCATTNLINGLQSIPLTAGAHTVEVRFFQYTGDKCLSWQWRGPDAGPIASRFYDIPDSRIRSYESYTPPVAPDVPQNLVAESGGMTQINLTWQYAGQPKPEFEIQRAASAAGPFAIINRVSAFTFADQNLVPATTYFYRLRSVNATGVSEFTPVVSATTDADTQPPTPPTSLVLYSKTVSSASIGWTTSTDDTGVTGYEIWANGVLVTNTTANFYLLSGLEPFVEYSVYVVAYDANQNKSEPSNTIVFTSSEPLTYFSKATGNLNELTTWGVNADGSGDSPSTFEINGLFLNIANRTTTQLGGPLTLKGSASRVIVPGGTTFTVENVLAGKVEVRDNGILVLNNAAVPELIDLSPGSLVQYNQNAVTVRPATYGNLNLEGTGTKNLESGTFTILGNLNVANGVLLQGSPGNLSNIVLTGGLNLIGTRASVAPENAVGIEFNAAGVQTISTQGNIELHQISTGSETQLTFNNPAAALNVRVGSPTGGGLNLATGSTLNLAGNNLSLVGAGTINAGDETGTIITRGGVIDITSSSDLNSNIFLDATYDTLSRFSVDLSGNGQAIARTPMLIRDGLKVRNGSVNANGNITLISTPTFTANLEEIEGSGQVIGNLNVQRYMVAKPRMYRYLSFPVEGLTIAHLQNYFPVTGSFTNASYDRTMSPDPSIFYYREPNWVAYPTTDNQAPLVKGEGYSVFIKNNTPFLMQLSGVPHQGNVPLNVFAPNTGGWNLVGNPYASTIQWSLDNDAWIKTNVSSVVAVRNNITATTSQFLYYDAATGTGTGTGGVLAGGRIAPGQAFYVRTTGANPALTITEKAKSPGQQTLYRESAEAEANHFKIALKKGTIKDEAVIALSDFATDDFDDQFDGPKQRNIGLFNFSSNTSNSVNVAINNLSDSFCSKSVLLNMTNVEPGKYSIEAESLESLRGVGNLTLLDHYTGKSVELFTTNEYTFEVNDNAASSASNRFELLMNRPSLETSINILTDSNCGDDGRITLANSQPGVMYTVFDKNNDHVALLEGTGDSLTVSLSKATLNQGSNQFKITAAFKGCATQKAESTVSYNYEPVPVAETEEIFVCNGSATVIRAKANVKDAVFSWFSMDGKMIKGNTTDTLQTDAITSETMYFVSASNAQGCAGPKAIITVIPQDMEDPILFHQSDSLYTNAIAGIYQWVRNGKLVAETNVPYHKVEMSGEYSVVCITGGCTKASSAISIESQKENGKAFVTVYPNPTSSSNINIKGQLQSENEVPYKIIDLLGKQVFSGYLEPAKLREGLRLEPSRGLNPGIYFLVVDDSQKKWKVRFVIKQ